MLPCCRPETSARPPNSTLIFRLSFLALFAGSGLPHVRCAHNRRLLGPGVLSAAHSNYPASLAGCSLAYQTRLPPTESAAYLLCTVLSGASGKSLVELRKLYKETCNGSQVAKADCGRAVSHCKTG